MSHLRLVPLVVAPAGQVAPPADTGLSIPWGLVFAGGAVAALYGYSRWRDARPARAAKKHAANRAKATRRAYERARTKQKVGWKLAWASVNA